MMIGSLLELYGLPWLLEIMCSGAHSQRPLKTEKVVIPSYSASSDQRGYCVTKTCCYLFTSAFWSSQYIDFALVVYFLFRKSTLSCPSGFISDCSYLRDSWMFLAKSHVTFSQGWVYLSIIYFILVDPYLRERIWCAVCFRCLSQLN